MSDVVTSESPSSGPSGSGAEGGGRKRAVLVGGVIGVLAVGGGAAWAATSFFGQGAQPAEALPAGTIGYASIDLDPSGGQKVAAIEMLRKFPAFKEEIGLDTDDDIRERIFTELTESGECEGLDYAEEIEPWLGQRAAVGAVDVGEEQPAPVVVVQVSDADAAEDGFATLEEKCGGGSDGGSDDGSDSGEESGLAVEGDWAVLAETQEQVDQVVDKTAEGDLASDEDFTRWMDEAGDPGVMSMYAAPEAGAFLAESFGGMGMTPDMEGMEGMEGLEGMEDTAPSPVPEELKAQLEDFQGGAATVRFADGSLEMEMAIDAGEQSTLLEGEGSGGEVVGSLPADTAVALGVSLPEGWTDLVMEQAAQASGGQMSAEDIAGEMEAATGLTPADLETALGESFALSLGSDLSAQELMASSGPQDLPLAMKVKGDTEEIEGVLDQVRGANPGELAMMLESESEGDYVVVGPSADYRGQVAGDDGGLGDSDEYTSVVDDPDDATSVFFVNFNGGTWAKEFADATGDQQVADNLEPLKAFGASGSVDDGVSHGLIRLTTD